MFAALLGLLLIANAVLCQNPEACDSQQVETRNQMCTAVANSVKGVGVAYDCQACQTKDKKPFNGFPCDVTTRNEGAPDSTTSYFLTPGKVEGKKVLNIETFDCVSVDPGKLTCEPYSPVVSAPYSPINCDISL